MQYYIVVGCISVMFMLSPIGGLFVNLNISGPQGTVDPDLGVCKIGASIGIAIMGAVMAGQMMSGLSAMEATEQTEQLADVARHPDMIVNPVSRGEISATLLPKLQGLLGMALQDVFFVGFIFSLLALASAFLVPSGSARQHARRE